jgi:hypothetical protein
VRKLPFDAESIVNMKRKKMVTDEDREKVEKAV